MEVTFWFWAAFCAPDSETKITIPGPFSHATMTMIALDTLADEGYEVFAVGLV